MNFLSIFDVIGPNMIGPSSSHTAGAVSIALMARKMFPEPIKKVTFTLYGSFAKTYRGHGTDRALLGGILGFATDDERIRDAFAHATDMGVEYDYVIDETTIKEDLKRRLVPTSRRFEKAYKTFKYFSSSPVKADDYAIVSLLLPLVNFSKSDERLRDYENLCHDKKISGLKFNKMKEKEYIVNFW